MNGEDRQLITGLFDRMRSMGRIEKDRDAEALIADQVRQNPDAAYMLVQSVLVQEHALQQAGARIEDLEARLRDLESRVPQQAPQQSGGFFGGLFGGGANRASVPPAGHQPAGFGQRPAAGFGQASPGFGGQRPMGGPMGQPGSPWAGQPGMQPGMMQPRQGGGFLQSAMATAAGVAGGMLLANSISGMLGGNSGEAQAADAGAATAQPAADTAAAEPAAEDPMMQDASFDDAGGDFGGGDFEV
jgi:hypothetical protein